MVMESWLLRVSCKVNVKPGFTLTLQETRSIHDSMRIPKIELISLIFQSHVVFCDFTGDINRSTVRPSNGNPSLLWCLSGFSITNIIVTPITKIQNFLHLSKIWYFYQKCRQMNDVFIRKLLKMIKLIQLKNKSSFTYKWLMGNGG